MRHLAYERGWEFRFGDSVVPVEAVFNAATYAPALLAAGSAELQARQIAFDLGIKLEGDPQSLFGARVVFDPSRNSPLAQMVRLVLSTMIIDSLPRSGSYICLDALQYMLSDEFSHFIQDDELTVEEAS